MDEKTSNNTEEIREKKNDTLDICSVRLDFSSVNPNQVAFKLGAFFQSLIEKLALKGRRIIADSTTIEYASKGSANAMTILIAVDDAMDLDNLELLLRRNINNVEISIKKTGHTMPVQ